MKKHIAVLLVAYLAGLPLSAFAQSTVSKEDILGAIRMSGALIACGYNDEGAKIGLAATELLPRVGLNDKSDEVAEAFVRGAQAIKDGELTCAAIVDHARKAGIFE